jgi:hypothetical protein
MAQLAMLRHLMSSKSGDAQGKSHSNESHLELDDSLAEAHPSLGCYQARLIRIGRQSKGISAYKSSYGKSD